MIQIRFLRQYPDPGSNVSRLAATYGDGIRTLLFFKKAVIWLRGNAPGENTPMEHRYKFHNIQITCWPTLEPFGFVPEIRINNAKLILIKTVKLTERFQTRTEAETYALNIAKQWIDDSNPDPPTA